MSRLTERVATPQANWKLADWLSYQEQLHPRGIALGLERVRSVAQRLGLLERPPPTLTIGGTNGKGSSATLAALICQEAGHKVGLYTSPHLLRYNERVQINGQQVDDATLCAAFARIESARGSTSLTYFEFGTLAALWLFREARVSVQVLEVGLGGRLDAVNIVDADAALVTNIGYDHLDWLGHDRDSIGREKAGIFRLGCPSVCADPQIPATLSHAEWQLSRDFNYSAGDASWSWEGRGQALPDLPVPGLAGQAQLRNAAGVITLLHTSPALGIAAEHIRAALPKLRLPGRFQRVGRVILDVAHNAEAAEVLAANLIEAGLNGKVQVVLGMLSDKPVETVGDILARVARSAWLGGLPGPRGLDVETLGARLKGSGMTLYHHADIPAAFAAACVASEAPVLVTGSFLSVAAVAEQLYG